MDGVKTVKRPMAMQHVIISKTESISPEDKNYNKEYKRTTEVNNIYGAHLVFSWDEFIDVARDCLKF